MTTIYGIPNCDTVKKARSWLGEHLQDARFHDFRKDGLTAEQVARWYAAVGDKLLNRKGTTWRGLDAAAQASAADAAGAQALALAHPALIKRPVMEWPDGAVTVGFDAADWASRIP
ncbi:Spx/MgsR family RNA polymerase-binding regulatory protein [Xylophilus rhododendri]|uniref:Spx/MgsR family RNA polymerase-binding regulatory protein n=1 Tax=Xylophilus rhododendri TaxID=2697032 RepID=A0A857J4R5_9BURK|nr:Spx/MgsR family RNA polymerase-binding regulatory protein [Xylophilus rhododendri]QHI98022.1 Spx/MgsR family RNA polymerase-binding regulatory protein [Xylophilus rhododendri]